ncbi:hypothetical protein [Tardiphaga sp. 42S5]|uniref:hypothetical protein n=1 Tax=Tardiphaga sp. 42S5 TaxID=1404799 RepID=UPI002A5B0FF8|nr:hypothetical protein [Tardiphaga sp. 42S5]WPO42196.1 hypothetical protein SFY93_03225 [Tardiphaga sp. 42S5]
MASISSFLEQFPPNLRKPMADLMSNIEMLSRVDLSKLISDGIEKVHLNGKRGFVGHHAGGCAEGLRLTRQS